MCGICGCDKKAEQEVTHVHALNHQHDDSKHWIMVEQNILKKNDFYASQNRQYFSDKKMLALNIMSSPGAGKTTLLSKTIADLKTSLGMAVIVGDQQTSYDADCIKESGITSVLQVNTGKGCHLDAHSIGHAVSTLSPAAGSILFIENIGNLVCPALFDLGEAYKVVILSVTEGDNKPLKYPDMFHAADLMLLTKTDLLPYVAFDVDQCITYARQINPRLTVLSVSVKQGLGLVDWYQWLSKAHAYV